jgi:hypothetical protein
MKHTVVAFLFLSFYISASSQKIVNAYSKDGKIFVQLDNGSAKQIVSEANCSILGFSVNKNIVIYQKVERKSAVKPGDEMLGFDQVSIRCYNLTSDKSITLFTTCLDGVGGTKPEYAGTSIFPNTNLCDFQMAMLNPEGDRLYFQTEGWRTSPAIHYYNLTENKLVFFKAGWLQKVNLSGVEVQITGIEFKNNQGQTESKGRFTQYCLYDKNGILIKELSQKEF